jgi:caspase-like apoptosis-related cysteine protease
MLCTFVAVSKGSHKNEDCLVVVVLTHGHEEKSLYAYDGDYSTDVLWSNFKADVCPELAGKPKIFIIQVSVKSARL